MSITENKAEKEQIERLVSVLKQGHESAITRQTLCNTMQMSDRKMRALIEKARDEGVLILNEQDGKGYYLPKSIKDIERQYRQDTSRAMAILKRRKHMRKILKEANISIR